MKRTDARTLRSPNLVLALLLLAYIFNFLDRQILGILAGPIIADLELTDAFSPDRKRSHGDALWCRPTRRRRSP